jgi:hypothetical protein
MGRAAEGSGLMRSTRQGTDRSVAMESRIAEQFQPVGMRLGGAQFGGTFADALGPVAAGEPPVVQVEPQQIQISLADLTPQEEVAAQTAVKILDQRTGPRGARGQVLSW